MWASSPAGFEVHLCCLRYRLPLPLYASAMPLVPFVRLSLPEANARFEGLESVVLDNDELPMVGESARVGPLALLSTAWVLMSTPTVARVDRTQVRPGAGKSTGTWSAGT